jgi:predicted CopG family antitoxin
MGKQIEIDLDVWKELVQLYHSEKSTENEVIRDLIESYKQFKHSENVLTKPNTEGPWIGDDVLLPEGTELRKVLTESTRYGQKGDVFTGEIKNGTFFVSGKNYNTPTAAAQSITDYGVNGWRFWECKLPGAVKWISLDALRLKVLEDKLRLKIAESKKAEGK